LYRDTGAANGYNTVSTIYVSGNNLYATEFYRTSSRLLKHDINEYTGDATYILLNISIKEYNLNINNSKGIGFIAEDTDPILSGENKTGHNLGNHLGLLTKGFQELEARVKKLEDGRIFSK